MSNKLSPAIVADLIVRLQSLGFKKKSSDGQWLYGAQCPHCKKNELFTSFHDPLYITCSRKTKCGYSVLTRDLWPDAFESWHKRAQKIEAQKPKEQRNPRAAADLYLSEGRGFDLALLKQWDDEQKTIDEARNLKHVPMYTQDNYFNEDLNIGTVTVRFPVANGHWERFLDNVDQLPDKAHYVYGTKPRGYWWQRPGFKADQVKRLILTEGIFDAIAWMHNGENAVSIMSSNNYPEKSLAELEKLLAQGGKQSIVLVWALDNDKAGRDDTLKHIRRARAEGWTCEAMQPPYDASTQAKIDWNDLHIKDKFSDEDKAQYKYQGDLLTAETASEKGILIYLHDKRGYEFHFEFNNSLYWFCLDLKKFEEKRQQLEKQYDEKGESISDDDLRKEALKSYNPVHRLVRAYPVPLYYQQNKVTGDAWYYFRVDTPSGEVFKDTFNSTQLSNSAEFGKRLLHIARGAVFMGSTPQVKKFTDDLLHKVKTVETIDYIGYSKEHGAYVIGEYGSKQGKIVKINDQDYFDFSGLALKTLSRSLSQSFKINGNAKEYKKDWYQIFWTAYGARGFAVLSFWFGSLFAEQIRAMHKSLFFLEMSGPASGGKTTLLEFLWCLYGRDGWEGFDSHKATDSGRARSLSQLSNLPVALIESDRDTGESDKGNKGNHNKGFDWDEFKTAYNGRPLRTTGMKTAGNETYEPPFRGALLISQNATVNGSEAIKQRICSVHFESAYFTDESTAAALQIKAMGTEHVSYFILQALKMETQALSIIKEKQPLYEKSLLERGEVKHQRIALNHGQLMAMLDALALVIDITPAQLKETQEFIFQMAAERQMAICDDVPIVQEFWEMVEYIRGRDGNGWELNHSKNPELFAISLNHFYAKARDANQTPPHISDLKKALKTSRKYLFKGQGTVKSSQYDDKNIYCWIFKKPQD